MLLVLGIWIMDVNGVRGLIITLLLSLRWMVMDVGIGSFLPPPLFVSCFRITVSRRAFLSTSFFFLSGPALSLLLLSVFSRILLF